MHFKQHNLEGAIPSLALEGELMTTTKLTLNEALVLAVKNRIPIELIPGETTLKGGGKSHRFHCLINHPDFPELSLLFGDEAHGHLFSAAQVRAGDRHIDVTEAAVRDFLETSLTAAPWTREMPAAENPVVLHGLVVTNPNLGEVGGYGEVLDPEARTVALMKETGIGQVHSGVTLTLNYETPMVKGETIWFTGVYSFPYDIL